MRNLFLYFIILTVSCVFISCASTKSPCTDPPKTENSIEVNGSFIPVNPAPKKRCNCELGATLSSINGESESYDKPLIGGQVGFSYLLGSGPLGFKPGINVAMAGSRYHTTYFNGSVTLVYLNAPLLANYTTPSGFFAEAGLQPGFLLSARDKYDGNCYNYKDYIQTFDLGIPVGLGYMCRNGLGVGARITPGVLNLNKDAMDGKDRNLVFSLRALYNF